MYIKLHDTTGEIYYIAPHHIAYLKEGSPTGSSSVIYKVVLNCGKHILLSEQEFLRIRNKVANAFGEV